MVLDKMTTAEVEVRFRLLVEMECEELELVMQELREAEGRPAALCYSSSRRRFVAEVSATC